MIIKRNLQKEGEWRRGFALFPVWTDDEIIWLESYEYSWGSTSVGVIGRYYRPVENPLEDSIE